MMTTARQLWPDKDSFGQCEAERTTRYAAYWEQRHPEKRCAHSAKYEINGKVYCQRHASIIALRVLLEGK